MPTVPDPDLGMPVRDKPAPGITHSHTTQISLEDEPALFQAGGRPAPVTTTTTRTPKGTAAAAARGAAVEAPASEASPEGSIGRDGKLHRPSPTAYQF